MDLSRFSNATVRGRAVNQNPAFNSRAYPCIEDPNGPNAYIQAAYERMRAQGQSHSMAEMLAYRQAPGAQTDREFQRGQGTLESQYGNDPQYLHEITQTAMRNGYKPNVNDVYVPGIAAFPGDPRAFVTDRGEIKKVAEERGLGISGMVKHKAPQPEYDPLKPPTLPNKGRRPIAPDIAQMIAKQDGLIPPDADKLPGSVAHKIAEKHGNHVV